MEAILQQKRFPCIDAYHLKLGARLSSRKTLSRTDELDILFSQNIKLIASVSTEVVLLGALAL